MKKLLKRIIPIAVVITVIAVFFTVFAAADEEAASESVPTDVCRLGDVNDDGKIQASDARAILRFSAKLDMPSDEQLILSDLSQNKIIEANDARRDLRISANLEERPKHVPGDEATCTEPQKCKVCGEILEEAKGHTPGAEATCTEPQVCTVCGEVLAEAKGHISEPRICTKDEICSVCGEVTRAAKEHTLDENGACTVCSEVDYDEDGVSDFVEEAIGLDDTRADTDEFDIYLAYNALEIGYSDGDYFNSVTNKLDLPVSYGEGEHEVDITWTSSDLNVVSENGDVNRPIEDNENILVTATLTKGDFSRTKEFNIRVIRVQEIIKSEIHDNDEDDLIALNENAEYDLEIGYNNDRTQANYISGKYSEINVNSIDTAVCSIYSVKSLIGLTDPDSELTFSAVNYDKYTLSYSFEQVYNDISIYGRTVTVNADINSGETRSISSSALSNSVLSSISLTPVLSIEELLNKYNTDSYELVIYSLDEYEESPVLAYVLHSDGEIVVVDANNADVLLQFQTTNDWGDYSTTGSGKTELGNTVTFPVQFHQWDSYFYLEDVQRKIYVHGDKAGLTEHEFNTEWGDKTANSAYTNVIAVYDWYKSHLGRNSIDNNGMSIIVNIHDCKNEGVTGNAHWETDNEMMCFFENYEGGIPTTAAGLDIIAHEMTHGVFQHVINEKKAVHFPYTGYTGSINEGYADVFGYFVDNDDWTIGEKWQTLRSLYDPESMGAPSKMSSPNYYRGGNQSVLVHTNSSIVYHAAYLMYTYGIRGNELEELWYNSMGNGYDATSDFITVRRCLIQAAKNLHFSNEDVAKIRRAFDTEEVFDNSGILSGKICKASDRNIAIPGATINVYKDDTLYTTYTSNEAGDYSIDIPAGEYYVEITAEGYIDFRSYATVVNGENTYMETFLLVEGEEGEIGTATGNIVNSLNNVGVGDITLAVRKDWNNAKEDAETILMSYTDENGDYSMDLPIGNYTVVVSKTGYLTGRFNIIVQPGVTGNQNSTITPIISGDDYLITLEWGVDPNDLDSHVVGKNLDGETFHVYFSDMTAVNSDGTVVCELDYDDTTSYGPEHITLDTASDEPYYYYIYKYAGSGTVALSGAKITVYQGNNLMAVFNVPTDLGDGDYWNVFAIKDGQIITKNTITDEADLSYANDNPPAGGGESGGGGGAW